STLGDSNDYTGTGEPDMFGQYLWTVPNDAVGKNNVRIKITNLGDENVFTESQAFTARGGFEFVDRAGVGDDSPLLGARWAVNSYQTIKWTTFGNISKVRVFYTNNGENLGAAVWFELSDPGTGVNNIGNFVWSSITNQIDPENYGNVRIKVADFNDEDAIGYSEIFTIHDIIVLDRPNGTDDPQDVKTLKVGSTESIKWHTIAKDTGGIGLSSINIEYSINGGQDWESPAIITGTDNDGLYDWLIPDMISDEVRVRITDVNDTQVFDISTNNCYIKPGFIINNPNVSSVWLTDQEYIINWVTHGDVPQVYIYYSVDNGQVWSPVLDEVVPIETFPYTNDGVFEWKVPSIARTSQAMVKIVSSTDVNAYELSSSFNIKGQLIVDYPIDGTEIFRSNTTETLSWTTKGIIPSVGLKYFYAGAWHNILNQSSGISHVNSGSFDWTVPNMKADDVKIMVYDIGDSNVKGESQNAFKIKPRLAIESSNEPKGGEVYLYGNTQLISWTTYGPISTVDIEYSKDGMQTWESTAVASSEPNNDSFLWIIPNAVSGDCYLRIADSSEPVTTYVISGKFRIRSSMLLIRPNGGIQVHVDDEIEIKWSQAGDTDEIYIYYFNTLDGVRLPVDGLTGLMPNPVDHSYMWTVPDFINSNIKVGVADPNDIEGTKDESNAVFPITALITVISPNSSSKWDIGSTPTIQWSWTGTVDTMNIYYSLNGVDYTSITLITGLVDNPDHIATYEWFINPVVINPSPDFYIKVADALDADTAYDVSEKAKIRADFTLDPPSQVEFIVGDTYTINWDCVGNVTNVKLHYSTDSGTTFPVEKEIINSTVNDGEYDWVIPDDISYTVRVRVMSSIDDDAYDISADDFRIKGDVWVISPVLDDLWNIDQSYDIKWGWKGTIPEIIITYSVNGVAGPFNPILEDDAIANDGIVFNGIDAGGEGSEHSHPWIIPDEATDDAIIRIRDVRESEQDILAESDLLHLIGWIEVKSPVLDDMLDVATTHDIKWAWGGTMPEVRISYSINGEAGPFNSILEDYDIPNDGIVGNGVGKGGLASEHTFTWTIPDTISTNCIVKVADTRDEANVYDDSGIFKIQGSFTLVTPKVTLNDNETPENINDDFYECRWITNEIREVTWTTFGTIPKVDIVYSKDDFVT
ncbi:MAG: hypothetical protein KAJ14_11520, partial [Candidatus Omnitrophica bacterium]|nr:hypothetical protein [Candidatus Omnitrophota bacterium]